MDDDHLLSSVRDFELEELNDDQEAELLGDSDMEEKEVNEEIHLNDQDGSEVDTSQQDLTRDDDILDIQADDLEDLDKSLAFGKKESSESDDDADDTDAKRRGRFMTERKVEDLTQTTKVVREIPESLDNVVPKTDVLKSMGKQNVNQNSSNQRRFVNDYQRNFNNKQSSRGNLHNVRRFPQHDQTKFRNLPGKIHINPNFNPNSNQPQRGSNYWESDNMKKNYQFQRNSISNVQLNQNNSNYNVCQRNLVDQSSLTRSSEHLRNIGHNQNPPSLHQNTGVPSNNSAFQQMNVGHNMMHGNMNSNNQMQFQASNFSQGILPLQSIVNQPIQPLAMQTSNMNFMQRGVGPVNNAPQSLLNTQNFWGEPGSNQQSMNFQNTSQQNNFQPSYQPLLPNPDISGLMQNRHQFPGHNMQEQNSYSAPNQMGMNQNQPKFPPNQLSSLVPNYPPPQIRPNNRNQAMNSNQKWPQQQQFERAPGMHTFVNRALLPENKTVRPKPHGYSNALTVITPVSQEELRQQGHIRSMSNEKNNVNLEMALNRPKRMLQQPYGPVKQQKLMDKPIPIANIKQNQSNIKQVPLVGFLPTVKQDDRMAMNSNLQVSDISSTEITTPLVSAILEISQNKASLPVEDETDEKTKELREKIEEQKKLRDVIIKRKEEKRRLAAEERRKAQQQTSRSEDLSNTKVESADPITRNIEPPQINKPIRPPTSASLVGPNLISYASQPQPRAQLRPQIQNAIRMPMSQSAMAQQFSGTPVRMNNLMQGNRMNMQFQRRPLQKPALMAQNSLGQPKFQTNSMEIRKSTVVIENLAASTTDAYIQKICQEVGSVKNLQVDRNLRIATVIYHNFVDAEMFAKRYHRNPAGTYANV